MYECSYRPVTSGIHHVSVRCADKPVAQSPYQVHVAAADVSAPARMNAFGPGLTDGVVGLPAQFTVLAHDHPPRSLS